jgi:cytochrome c oxidase subunit 4
MAHAQHSAKRLTIVYVALMALAALSFALAGAHLGGLDVVIALVIAVAKTLLVVLFFMELIEHRFVNTMIVLVSAGFVVLMLTLMMADVLTRKTFPPGPLPAANQSARR